MATYQSLFVVPFNHSWPFFVCRDICIRICLNMCCRMLAVLGVLSSQFLGNFSVDDFPFLFLAFPFRFNSYKYPCVSIHLVEIKYCEDARPQNQLNAAKDQHKDLCNILQGASITFHIILLGVGGTIYNTHTLKPFKELGLDSQRVNKLASKLHVHSVNFAAKLVRTRRAISSTVINSHQEPVSGQTCNPPDPHWYYLSFSRWRSFTVVDTKK